MTPLDLGSTALVLFAAMLAGALFGAAIAWRRVQAEAGGLPVWQFMRRAGISRADLGEGRRMSEVELSCRACAWQEHCRRRVAAGKEAPEHCPNASFLLPAGQHNTSY